MIGGLQIIAAGRSGRFYAVSKAFPGLFLRPFFFSGIREQASQRDKLVSSGTARRPARK